MEDKVFEIEKILDERASKEYLIKWANYDETYNTWEPEKQVSHLKGLITNWEKRKKSETGSPTTSSQVTIDTPPSKLRKNSRNVTKRKIDDVKDVTPSKRATPLKPTKLTPTVAGNCTKVELITPSSSKETERLVESESVEEGVVAVKVSDQDELSVLLRKRLEECTSLFLEDLGKHRKNVVDESKEKAARQEEEFQNQCRAMESEWEKEKRILEDNIKNLQDEKNELLSEMRELKLQMEKDEAANAANKKAWENIMNEAAVAKEQRGKLLNVVNNCFKGVLNETVKQESPEIIPLVQQKLAAISDKAIKYDKIMGIMRDPGWQNE